VDSVTAPRALIVDDNFYNRDLCALVLKRTGYAVQQAENGQQALDLLRSQAFDLLVLDLAMPVMDGVTVMRNLRSEKISEQTFVIIITANPHMVFHPEFDVDYIINKPMDIVAFEQLVVRLKSKSNTAD
jgi:two-component system alkaline phosphatase synthesis response regulator PhoP